MYETAMEELSLLLDSLEAAGFHTEVRPGYEKTILVFVKAPKQLLGSTVYKSRYLTHFALLLTGLAIIIADHPSKSAGLAVQYYTRASGWR